MSRLESDDLSDLDELLAYANPVDGVMASILMMESYDTTFGLHSHEDEHEPLSLITMHPKENTLLNGKLQTTIKAFRKHRVGHHMNMSLSEFLNYPRHVTKMILKDCEDAERTEAKRAADIMAGIDGNKK
jgi:hypothetical protein